MDNLAKHLALSLYTLWCTHQGLSTELQAGELLESDQLTPPQRQWLEIWDKLWESLE